jgi:hypothetical protein
MYAVNDADERVIVNNSRRINALGSRGQHAIEAWESEGGSPASAPDECDLALAGNVGWRASDNAGWLANPPLLRMPDELPQRGALKGRIARILHTNKDRAG